MSAATGTVFLVDDDTSVVIALSRLLRAADFTVVAFSSAEEFLEKHDAAAPGCALVDYSMPGMNGLELQKRLAEGGCERPIVFLTGQGDIPVSVQAMKAGAVDFLTKPVREAELLAAIRHALGKDQASHAARLALADIRSRLAKLTPRESEILRFIIAGLLNKQIAWELGTAEKTIKVHRGRIMQKLGVRSVADLTRIAIQAGITPAKSGARQ